MKFFSREHIGESVNRSELDGEGPNTDMENNDGHGHGKIYACPPTSNDLSEINYLVPRAGGSGVSVTASFSFIKPTTFAATLEALDSIASTPFFA